MPLQRCEKDGKPGWKWGGQGKCYTYTSGDPKSEGRAKEQAKAQAAAIIISRGKDGTSGRA